MAHQAGREQPAYDWLSGVRRRREDGCVQSAFSEDGADGQADSPRIANAPVQAETAAADRDVESRGWGGQLSSIQQPSTYSAGLAFACDCIAGLGIVL